MGFFLSDNWPLSYKIKTKGKTTALFDIYNLPKIKWNDKQNNQLYSRKSGFRNLYVCAKHDVYLSFKTGPPL